MGYRPVILLVIMCVMVDQWMFGSEHGIQACYMAGYRCVMGPDACIGSEHG